MSFITVFVVVLFALAIPGALILIAAGLHGQQIIDQKNRKEEAKIRVDVLRAQRLERDQLVVENRAHLVATQEALAALRIEKLRRNLGMPADHQTPVTQQGTDSPSW